MFEFLFITSKMHFTVGNKCLKIRVLFLYEISRTFTFLMVIIITFILRDKRF